MTPPPAPGSGEASSWPTAGEAIRTTPPSWPPSVRGRHRRGRRTGCRGTVARCHRDASGEHELPARPADRDDRGTVALGRHAARASCPSNRFWRSTPPSRFLRAYQSDSFQAQAALIESLDKLVADSPLQRPPGAAPIARLAAGPRPTGAAWRTSAPSGTSCSPTSCSRSTSSRPTPGGLPCSPRSGN